MNAAETVDVVVEREGGVLRLLLARPERRNALTPGMREILLEELRRAAVDESVRVVVIRGAGGHFCAGGDVSAMGARTAVEEVELLQGSRRIIEAMAALPKPVIAAVEGAAVGAGFALAMAADIIVSVDSARFMASYVQRGLGPDQGCSWFLTRQLGPHRARRYLLTGETMPAADAHAYGLVARVWSETDFEEELAALTAQLANGPTRAYAAVKRITASAMPDLATALDSETWMQSVLVTTDDHAAAVEAFRSRSAPTFRGR
jgi:2-(1,2-epoxy-1,2-dihydrophenyl)acetyl-CoA isomerase